MAAELGEGLGGRIGLTTRDERRVSRDTIVEVVTEGVLVRRLLLQGDLPGVSAVLFDEFHERSLDADLGLALVLELREVLRPELRVGVLSATIDAAAVAALVGPGTPVVASEGRAFPVEVTHVDLPPLSSMRPRELAGHVAPAVADAAADTEGDVLVFLPGVAGIRETRAALSVKAEVVELHGGLPPREQDRALRPGTGPRIVLATDLAESSVTVPSVRTVVDAGLAREPRLDPRLGMTRLVTVPASRASADQRAGRAGRVAAGRAVRLWGAASHGARPAWPVPELAQGDLAGMRLALAAWGTMPADARLLDPIPGPALAEAESSLRELDALDDDGRITEHGRVLSGLPMHPRLAQLLTLAAAAGKGPLGAELAALLSERDVLGRDPTRPDADLWGRVLVLRGDRRGRRVRDRTLDRVRRDAKRFSRLAADLPGGDATSGVDEEAGAGILLARTWPDRIGRARPGRRGQFQLAGGRGAVVDERDPLAGEGWIVAVDVDAGRVDARVHRAIALDADSFDGPLADLVTVERRARWDDEAGDVEAVEVAAIGQLERWSRPLSTDEVDLREALLDAVRQRGLRLLDWSRDAEQLRARLGLLHRTLSEPWPSTDDKDLLGALEAWLWPRLAPGARRLSDLRRVDLVAALGLLVPPTEHHRLDDLVPTRMGVPSGSRIRLDYTPEGPVLAVKVQEVLGWKASPTVVDGKVPVTLHLLSPAGRPLQVTADLAGFWDGAWSQVRAEMRGRYPKHAWPEDPREVPAHRGTKNRQRRG